MRETKFIQQNKEKWQEFERTLEQPHTDPDKLNDLFVQITDDLSYSRTFYPNRSVRVYLNGLAQRVFSIIYKKRKPKYLRLFTFWTQELPILVYQARRDFLIATLVFAVAFLIGLVSSKMDPEYASIILGQDYIEMTKENIASGDPMAVYKQRGRFSMSLAITMNNLWVAFLTFVMGAIYGIGSLIILIRNGAMVGVFQYFFIEEGLFWESFLTIWIHGTLEISAIVIAGAAGLTMGRGLAFPGTYTRLRAFQKSAKRGLKIMLGIAPIFVIAGFIEGYLTRQTDTPDSIRLLFILGCLAFVIFYFGIFPRMQARNLSELVKGNYHNTPKPKQQIDFQEIKTRGQIFSESFLLFRSHWRPIFWAALACSLLYSSLIFNLSSRPAYELFYFPADFMGTISRINTFFINKRLDFLPFINILIFGAFLSVVFRIVAKAAHPEEKSTPFLLVWLKTLPGVAILVSILWTNEWYTLFLFIFGAVIPLLWIYTVIAERRPSFTGLQRSLVLLSGMYSKALSTLLIFLMIGFLFFSLLDTALFSLYFDIIGWFTNLEGDQLESFSMILQVTTSMFMIFMILSIIGLGFGILYHSLLEIQEAPGLAQRIKTIGQQRSIRGLDKETD
ncbi:MAG: hypothetical protein Sapg2KO_16200 [Saprospiraceae bacterium]